MSKNIIWGAGAIGKALVSYIKKKNITVECIVDKNPEKCRGDIEGISVYAPNDVFGKEKDVNVIIAIGEKYAQEVYDALLNYGIDEDKIIYYSDIIKHDNNSSNIDFGVVTGYIPIAAGNVLKKNAHKNKIVWDAIKQVDKIILYHKEIDNFSILQNRIESLNKKNRYTRKIYFIDKYDEYELEKIDIYSYATEWSPDMFKAMSLFYLEFMYECTKHNISMYTISYNDIIYYEGDFLYDNILNLKNGKLQIEQIKEFIQKFVPVLLLMKVKKFERAFLYINHDLNDMCIKDVEGYISWDDRNKYHALLDNIKSVAINDNMNHIIELVRTYIESIDITARDVYMWDSYQNGEFECLNNAKAWSTKQKEVVNMIKSTGAHSMLDLAGNMGWYCIAMKEQMNYAVVADIDYNCIDYAYNYIKKNNIKNVYPIQMNVIAPPMDTYKNMLIGNKTGIIPWRNGAMSRYKSDVVLALAIVHHLAFSQQLSFEEIINQIAMFSNKWIIIEYVHREDEYVFKYLQDNPQFDWYNNKFFVECLQKKFEVIERKQTSSTRTLYLCTQKSDKR